MVDRVNVLHASVERATDSLARDLRLGSVIAVLQFPAIPEEHEWSSTRALSRWKSTSDEIGELVTGRMSRFKGLSAVERSQALQVLRERQHQQASEVLTDEEAAGRGRELKADVVVLGTIRVARGELATVFLRSVRVSDSRVLNSAKVGPIEMP